MSETNRGVPDKDRTREMVVEIIETYFHDQPARLELLEQSAWPRPPVRGIFSELHNLKVDVAPKHREAIKDAIFLWG